MLHYGLFTWKGNCYYGFTDVLIAVAINIRNKVLFNIEYFKNFLPFSSIPFTISGAQFKEAGYSKYITVNSGNYLIMSVTFDVSTCNRMIKLTIASKLVTQL